MNKELLDIKEKAENSLSLIYKNLDDICFYNSNKVIEAFRKENVNELDFNGTTGYGYGDVGRDKIENIFSNIFKSEASLVRMQIISGTHALTIALFGVLRPGDLMLSVSGKPYDTLDEVIGIKENKSSLISFGIKYDQIDLINNDFDYENIVKYLENNKVKVLYIQRSKGYSTRKSISIEKLEKLIKMVRKIDKEVIIMVDNCYCEFVTKKEPIEVGADLAIGSLIKNLGGCIAPNGGYITGRKDLVDLCGERLTAPGEGKDIGPSLNNNKLFLQGIASAPRVVRDALKTAIFTSKVMEDLGYDVEPKYNDERVDIVQNIIFNDKDKLIKYCKEIQKYSLVESGTTPVPGDMPGYDDQIIMASGSFTQGSSIEFSCDGPIRSPYIAYQQGSFTYEYGIYAILNIVKDFVK